MFFRATHARRFALLHAFIAGLMVAACSDREPGGVKPPEPTPPTPRFQPALLLCTADLRTGGVACAPQDAGVSAADAAWRAMPGGRAGLWTASGTPEDPSLIIGGQGVNVTLTGSNVVYSAGTQEFTFDVTITSHIGQPLGTIDGINLHPSGARVFFQQLPVKTGGDPGAPAGPYTVVGHGTATFTASDQAYYQFDEIIGDEQTSGPVQFKFTSVPPDITFQFRVLVWAPVQWPDGWVAVTPTDHTLELSNPANQSVNLNATVYSRLGEVVAETVTWASGNPSVATVDGSGLVAAVSAGSTVVTASAAGRADGTSDITVVADVDLTESTVTTALATLTADGSSTTTVTVQLKDGAGNDVFINAGTVALSNTGAGSLSAVTYVGSGAYSATLTAPTVVGVDTISATLDAAPLTNKAVVEYTPGAPTVLHVEASDSTPDPNTLVTVTAQLLDAHGNFVKTTGVSVAWSATNGGSFGATPTNTNANGIATAQFTTAALGGATQVIAADAPVPGISGTVTLTLNNLAPAGGADSYNGIGNVTLHVPAGSGLLMNDVSNDGGTLAAVAETVTSTQGGSATIAADGSFSFRPFAGFTNGNDTFKYQVVDDLGAADTVTVTIAMAGIYWFVDATGSGTGTQANPAPTLAAASSAAANSDTILVVTGSYAGVSLKNGQVVRGAGNDSAIVRNINGNAHTLLAVGARPTITTAISVSVGNTIQNIDLSSASGNGITGSTIGTLKLRDMNISANGVALQLTNGTLDAVLGTMSASGSGVGAALQLTNIAGSLTASGGALAGGTLATVYVDGSTVDVTYPGTITGGSGKLVHILNRSGGTLNFSGNLSTTTNGITIENNTGGTNNFSGTSKSITAATGAGVSLVTNTGATTNFTNGGLVISTTGVIAFNATGGGTFTVTGSGNDLSSTNANVILLQNVTANMMLGNVSASGNNAGVHLTNVTGSVTGTGGTITGSSGGPPFYVSGGAANTTWGGNLSQANNVALVNVLGAHTGTLTFTGTLSATNGTGLQFNNADGTYQFSGTTTLNGGDARVVVSNGSTGTITFGANTSITNPTSEAVSITNSGPVFTYNGRIVKSNGGTGITLSGNSGTFNLGSRLKQISSASSVAVNVTSNSGTMTSGDSLQITTTTGTGFNATVSGTVNIQGAWNTVASGSGTAVNFQGVNVGSSGVTWRSISHSGGANGISLVNTGNTGGSFTVTGDGTTNGSGGSIVNTTGADGATAGNGIYLSGTRNISLNWMALSGHANNGLYGTGVRGNLTVNKVRFTGTNGNSGTGTFKESAIQLVNHGGATRITNSRLDGAAYNALRIENITGSAPAIDSLVIENDTIATMQGSTMDVRGSAILVSLSDGTGDVRIRNNRVLTWWGNGINVAIQGTASGTSRITGNFVDNTNGALAGAGGIWVAGGQHTYLISGNTVRHTNGAAISADRIAAGSLMQGTIETNAIGVAGDNNSGSAAGAGIFASHHGPGTSTHRIRNNTIRQVSGTVAAAIWVLTGDAPGFGGSGTLNATITGNDLQQTGSPSLAAHMAILVTVGTQGSTSPIDADVTCLDIGGAVGARNSITNFNTGFGFAATAENRLRVNQRFNTTSRFPGYTGVATGTPSQNDLATYLLGRNTASNSTNANTSTGGFLNTVPAGSACPQPAL